MSKTLIAAFFSTLLIFSIAAPIVVSYMDLNVEAISYSDFSEKEKKDKNEIDVVEKDLINLISSNSEELLFEEKALENYFYLNKNQAYTIKILLPPPEFFI